MVERSSLVSYLLIEAEFSVQTVTQRYARAAYARKCFLLEWQVWAVGSRHRHLPQLERDVFGSFQFQPRMSRVQKLETA